MKRAPSRPARMPRPPGEIEAVTRRAVPAANTVPSRVYERLLAMAPEVRSARRATGSLRTGASATRVYRAWGQPSSRRPYPRKRVLRWAQTLEGPEARSFDYRAEALFSEGGLRVESHGWFALRVGFRCPPSAHLPGFGVGSPGRTDLARHIDTRTHLGGSQLRRLACFRWVSDVSRLLSQLSSRTESKARERRFFHR